MKKPKSDDLKPKGNNMLKQTTNQDFNNMTPDKEAVKERSEDAAGDVMDLGEGDKKNQTSVHRDDQQGPEDPDNIQKR